MNAFGKRFYNEFKKLGLEKKLTVKRNNLVVTDNLIGIVSDDVLMLPPDIKMTLQVHDEISDNFNHYVVTKITDSGGKGTVWQVSIEDFDKFKITHAEKPTITNNISNSGTIGQNFGDHSHVDVSQSTNASLQDLSDLLMKVKQSDRQELVELVNVFENLRNQSEPVRKGFLSRFNGLIKKYPDISNLVSSLFLGWITTGTMK